MYKIGLVQANFQSKMKFSGYYLNDMENNLSYLYENKLWKQEKTDIRPKGIELPGRNLTGLRDDDEELCLMDDFKEPTPPPFKNSKEILKDIHNVNLFVLSLRLNRPEIRNKFFKLAEQYKMTVQSFIGPNYGRIGYPDGEYIIVPYDGLSNLHMGGMGIFKDFIDVCVIPSLPIQKAQEFRRSHNL